MEEKRLKILGVQISSKIGDKEANFSKVIDIIDKNITKDTDIIILPEVWSIGWKPSEFQKSAEYLDNSKTIDFLSVTAKKYKTNIIGGSFISKIKHTNKTLDYFNTCPVINRKGELIATYNKMHLFSYYGCDEGKYIQHGQKLTIVEINGVKIGLTVCYDIRFPEIYRAYAKAGADLLINIAAWGINKEIPWDVLTRAKAIENQCWFAAVNQCGLIENEDWNWGHSRIINYKGEIISEINNNNEGLMITTINFKEMYEFRKKCRFLLDIHDKYELE